MESMEIYGNNFIQLLNSPRYSCQNISRKKTIDLSTLIIVENQKNTFFVHLST